MTDRKPRYPEHSITGAIAFLREAWRGNDGAEGESVKLVCNELERLRGLDLGRAELAAELQKHQDLVEALQWLPAGTEVNFADLDDFLEELRAPPWRWLPQRECDHKNRIDERCVRCGEEP